MPVVSKKTASQSASLEGLEVHYEEVDGYTIAFEQHTRDADRADLFKGLPGDRCQAAHWGVVLKGKMIYRYGDREDVIHAGEAYYAPPGHTPLLFAGTELIEFSNTTQLAKIMGVVMENLEAAGR